MFMFMFAASETISIVLARWRSGTGKVSDPDLSTTPPSQGGNRLSFSGRHVCVQIQGLGMYALEEHRFSADGHLETVGAGKYHIPTVSSVPLEMNVTLLKDSDNPKVVYSSKV